MNIPEAILDMSGIRKVLLRKGKDCLGRDEIFFVYESELIQFITAQERLHHVPGFNPHNSVRTTHLTYLEVSVMDLSLNYKPWWADPDLSGKFRPATIIGWRVLFSRCYPSEE